MDSSQGFSQRKGNLLNKGAEAPFLDTRIKIEAPTLD